MNERQIELKNYIRSIPDWPKKGVLFRDITPLLADSQAFSAAIDALCGDYSNSGANYVAAVDARGFIFGAAVAQKLRLGFLPIRKKGKLPHEIVSSSYELEYGTDTLEMHRDAMKQADKVLLVDDLLATGGTMSASCKLIEQLKGEIVGISFLIELTDLNGREKLGDYKVSSVIRY